MATETCLTLHNCLCADHRRIQFSCENSECCQCQIDVRSKTSDGKDDEGSDGEIEEESEWSDGKNDEGSEWSDGEDEEELESSGGEETPSRKRKAETAHQSPVKRAKSGSSASMAQRRNFEAVSAQIWKQTKAKVVDDGMQVISLQKERAALVAAEVHRAHYSGDEVVCLVTLQGRFRDMCHVVPSRISAEDHTLTRLEFCWGIPHGELFIHTRYNLIPLSPTVHRAFDSKAFGFLPDHDSLSLISTISLTNQGGMQATNLSVEFKTAKGSSKGDVVNAFKYDVVFFDPDALGTITRNVKDGSGALAPDTHASPFHKFPKIYSHMHPHFAIFNFGSKFRKLYGSDPKRVEELVERSTPAKSPPEWAVDFGERITILLEIYDGWMRAKIPKEFSSGREVKRRRNISPGGGMGSRVQTRSSNR